MTPLARITLAVVLIAAIAISDAWLYFRHGTQATYSARIYRASSRWPVLALALGALAAWWCLRSGLADDWKVLILAVGVLLGHLTWAQESPAPCRPRRPFSF